MGKKTYDDGIRDAIAVVFDMKEFIRSGQIEKEQSNEFEPIDFPPNDPDFDCDYTGVNYYIEETTLDEQTKEAKDE